MRLLVFSDLHADARAARNLVERGREVDVLVGAGDFAILRKNLHVCLYALREIGRPTVLVPGNHESAEELEELCGNWPQAHVLHGAGAEIQGVQFFGIGGGIPTTPFGPWSYDFTEEEAEGLLAACPPECVLVSHSPPKSVVDGSSLGKSLGSTAVRAAVERLHPLLVVCGHIHQDAGRTAYIGETPVVNAGPEGIEWTL